MSRRQKGKAYEEGSESSALGSLLQKKRSREKSLKVEEILSRDISPEEKIHLIDQVDGDRKTVELTELEKDAVDLESLLRRENILTREAARQIQKSIKTVPEKRKLYQFFFEDYRKLKALSRRSSFLNVRFFPPRVSIDREMTELFFSRMRNDAAELAASLRLILSIAWQHLEKMEYNLIVQLDLLCRRIIDLNLQLMDFRHGQLSGQISHVERHFIICRYKNHYPELIILKIKEAIKLHPELSLKKNRIITLAESLLENSPGSLNLGSFFTAANAARFRQHLPFYSLYWSGYSDIINTYDFECSEEVRHNIETAVENTSKDLFNDISKKRELEHISAYVKITPDGSFDYQPLAIFYNNASKIHGSTFDEDRDNILIFIIRFFDIFFLSFTEILSGEVRLEEKRKGRIFSSSFFQFELEKLYLLQQRLAKYPYDLKEFPKSEFTKMILISGAETGPKREAAGIARELLEHLSSVASRLMRILKSHNGDAQQYIAGEPRVISEEVLNQGNFAIPWYSDRIDEESEGGGERIHEYLTNIVTLILLFSRFLREERADQFLSSLEILNRSIAANMEKIRRLANTAQYYKIKEQHSL